jgi:putative hemolysin
MTGMNRSQIVTHALSHAPTMPRPERASSTRLSVSWASSEAEVREAQALRYQVFAVEMGARLAPTQGKTTGLDIDLFDAYCEHVLVRAGGEDGEPGPVVGTYRVLTPAAAKRAGGFYSDTEFDLTRLRGMRSRVAEIGRSCVHADHRSGGAIIALWGAMAEFMARNGLDTVIGCASVSMRDGGHFAASLWKQIAATHLAPIDCQVRPRLPLPIEHLRQDLQVEPPALIRGYLRCGAKLMGEPAWDPDFNTADLPLLVRMADLPARFRRITS